MKRKKVLKKRLKRLQHLADRTSIDAMSQKLFTEAIIEVLREMKK